MPTEATTTGVSLMGDMPWGTHFCYFFETKQDLLDASVPFFQAGLERHEFCLWIVYAPVTEADALEALRRSIPGLDRHVAEGGIEIRVHTEPLFENGLNGDAPEAHSGVQYLHQKLDDALARGFAGMRVAGSPACLQKANPRYFREFEKELGRSAADRRLIALCHFPLAESSAAEILDAARTHQFVVSRRQGKWETIEAPQVKLTKEEITKLNGQLEQRVEERTRALEEVNQEFRKEIARRERVEEELRKQKEVLQTIFDHIPVMVSFMDRDNRVKLLNREWQRVLGWSFEETRDQDVDIVVGETFPDPEYREQARNFIRTSDREWADFKIRVRDGRVLDTSWAILRLSDGTAIAIGQDISGRKQAEEELRKQNEVLQTIFDHIPVMIGFVDRNGQPQLVNREWERTLGWSLENIRGHNIDIIAENYPDAEYRKQVRDFLRNSNAEWADFKTRVRDGQVIDTSWAMLHLSDGTSIGIGQDITERKHAEEALRESEERFRQLAENIQDLFWIKTADFKRVLYLSPAYERILGRSSQDRYRDEDYQPFLDNIVPEDREKMAEIMRQGARGEFEIEFRITRPDGSVRWFRDRGFPVRDRSGRIYRIAGIATDITERKLAVEALRESEERFRQITENIREVFWLRSPDLRELIYVSPMYEKVCGRSRESLRMEGPEVVVHPEDRPRVIETLEKLAGREFEIEYRIITKEGAVRWIRDRGFPISDESGAVYRMGGVAEDITDRKEAGDRLKASSEQLRALSASLQSARESEAKRIAHQIHDELGGHLTGLRWELEALDKILQKPAGAEQVRAMRDKLAAMLGLTDGTINAVRRIASELRPSILDDLGLLEAIEWQTQQFEIRTGIQCRCDCALQTIPLGNQQSTAVFRIVQEALTNILRHAQATRVDVAMKKEDGAFVLTVTDNGRGITPAEMDRRESLGLLGMRERAHLIGGEVDIVGLTGTGTTLCVRVPLGSEEPEEAP
jgi:PAS domain S-box-containing protein